MENQNIKERIVREFDSNPELQKKLEEKKCARRRAEAVAVECKAEAARLKQST